MFSPSGAAVRTNLPSAERQGIEFSSEIIHEIDSNIFAGATLQAAPLSSVLNLSVLHNGGSLDMCSLFSAVINGMSDAQRMSVVRTLLQSIPTAQPSAIVGGEECGQATTQPRRGESAQSKRPSSMISRPARREPAPEVPDAIRFASVPLRHFSPGRLEGTRDALEAALLAGACLPGLFATVCGPLAPTPSSPLPPHTGPARISPGRCPPLPSHVAPDLRWAHTGTPRLLTTARRCLM